MKFWFGVVFRINGIYGFNIATGNSGSPTLITNGESSVASTSATTGNNQLTILGNGSSSLDFTGATIKLAGSTSFNSAFEADKYQSWKIATVPSGVSVGGLGAVTVDTTDFAAVTGSFSLSQTGTEVFLNYSPVPVPEPAAVLGIAVGALALGGLVRRLRVRKADATAIA